MIHTIHLQCDKCDYVTNRLLRLRTHKKKPHYLCEQCSYVASSRFFLKKMTNKYKYWLKISQNKHDTILIHLQTHAGQAREEGAREGPPADVRPLPLLHLQQLHLGQTLGGMKTGIHLISIMNHSHYHFRKCTTSSRV